MTDVIQLLPDSVANQIAAGEVIQRPASVIKELVENAVDAGATTINVLVVDAGRTSIQVIDDGCGMSETDARLAFERHATSKIRQASDLFSLQTMGFRGEALPSIAAVAQVELRTRRASDEVGTCLQISGSHVESQEPCSCAVGSRFTVSNIFFNVPARRKFLKSNATELNNILMAFERIVLVYPAINFTLHSNGQELMNLRGGTLRQRRKKGAHEYFFVNGRYMKHPYFHKAVQQAYDRLIQIGTHVPYFIYFDVSPADIDVNIHPTKTEIKFENEQAIWQILAAAVKDAIGQFCEIPQIDFDTEGKPDIPVFNPTETSHMAAPVSHANPQYNPFRQKPSQDWQKLYEGLPKETKPAEVPLFDEPPSTEENLVPQSQPAISDMAPTHYQYKGRYIMTAVKSGLMIIDQHRADIRVRYERYLHQLAEAPAESQRLLFPEVLELSPAEAALVTDLLPALTNLGFELTSLGPASYAVNGVPAGIEGLRPSHLLQELLASPSATVSRDTLTANTQLALSLARHAAIPYGQLLSNEEMDVLVNDLFACENVNYTPDGKNILSILPQRDIERLIE